MTALAAAAPLPVAQAHAAPGATTSGATGTSQDLAAQLNAVMQQTSSLISQMAQITAELQQIVAGLQQISGGGPNGSCCCCCCSGSGQQQAMTGTALVNPADVDPSGGPAAAATQESAPAQPAPQPQGENAVRAAIVAAAAAEIGVREEGGANRGQRLVDYRSAVTGPGEDPNLPESWCADFTSWVWAQAGNPMGDGGIGYDYCPQIKDWAERTGRWQSREQGPVGPGDAILFSFKGQRPDHVAIVEKVENGRVHTIGGNESDQVKRNSYDLSDSRILGYVRAVG